MINASLVSTLLAVPPSPSLRRTADPGALLVHPCRPLQVVVCAEGQASQQTIENKSAVANKSPDCESRVHSALLSDACVLQVHSELQVRLSGEGLGLTISGCFCFFQSWVGGAGYYPHGAPSFATLPILQSSLRASQPCHLFCALKAICSQSPC